MQVNKSSIPSDDDHIALANDFCHAVTNSMSTRVAGCYQKRHVFSYKQWNNRRSPSTVELSRRRRFFKLATFTTEVDFGPVRVLVLSDLLELFGAILEVCAIGPRPSTLESTRPRSVWG